MHGEEGGVKGGDVEELPEALRGVVEAGRPAPCILGDHVPAADEIGPELLRALRLGKPAWQADLGHLSDRRRCSAHQRTRPRATAPLPVVEQVPEGDRKVSGLALHFHQPRASVLMCTSSLHADAATRQGGLSSGTAHVGKCCSVHQAMQGVGHPSSARGIQQPSLRGQLLWKTCKAVRATFSKCRRNSQHTSALVYWHSCLQSQTA